VRKKTNTNNTEILLESIIQGIVEKKGNNITVMDLKKTGGSICDYFVICDAESTRQVTAIADSVDETVYKEIKDKVIYKEGYENSFWILLDYSDVIVHIFQKASRETFNLEGLWADAIVRKIEVKELV